MQRLILASQSKLRQSLMKSLSVPFDSIPANIDEKAIQDPDPSIRIELVARSKVDKIASAHKEGVIIAGDTVVILNDTVLEKPTDSAEAKYMLQSLSGQDCELLNGMRYLDRENGIDDSYIDIVHIHFRILTDEEIDTYIETQPVLTWAGAFAPIGFGATFIQKINGSFTGFMYGLSAEWLIPLLRKSGFTPIAR